MFDGTHEVSDATLPATTLRSILRGCRERPTQTFSNRWGPTPTGLPWTAQLRSVGLVAFGMRMVWVLAFARVPSGTSAQRSAAVSRLRAALRRRSGLRVTGRPAHQLLPTGLSVLPRDRVPDDRCIGSPAAGVPRSWGGVQSLLWAIAAIAVVLTARWAFDSARVGIAAGLGTRAVAEPDHVRGSVALGITLRLPVRGRSGSSDLRRPVHSA